MANKKEGIKLEQKIKKIGIVMLIAISMVSIASIFATVSSAASGGAVGGVDNSSPLTISADTSFVYVGVPKDVNFEVRDENLNVVSAATVQLTGAASGTGTTNDKGITTITINAQNSGTITAEASKDGYIDGGTTIKAEDAQLNITADTKILYVGKSQNVTFTVNHICGSISGETCSGSPQMVPTSNALVSLTGPLSAGDPTSGTTDSIGQVKIPINATSQGTITATANATGFLDGTTTISTDYLPSVNITVERDKYSYGELINLTLTNNGSVAIDPTSWIVYLVNNGWVYQHNLSNSLAPGQSMNLEWDQKNYLGQQVIKGIYRADIRYSYRNNNYVSSSNKFEITDCANIIVPTKTYSSYAGDAVTFTVNLSSTNETWNFKWLINGTKVFEESDVNKSVYSNKSSSIGTWNVTAIATHDCTVITWQWLWTVVAKPPTNSGGSSGGSSGSSSGNSGSSGGGGGGGGGGGVISGEAFNNILSFEREDGDLVGNQPVTYSFKNPAFSIYQVLVTGKTNEGDIGMRLEHLKTSSSLVNRNPPGDIYANENVWLGSKRISSVLVRFRVKNSWMTDNNLDKEKISLLRFESEWMKLNTKITSSDANYTYFEARSSGLSSFAISGVKEEVQQVQTTDSASAQIQDNVNDTTPTPVPTNSIPGFGIISVIGAISAIYLIAKRRK